MFRSVISRLDRATVGAGSLGALADRVGAVLLPTSVVRATGSGGCHLVGCGCAPPHPSGPMDCAWMYECAGTWMCSDELCSPCEPI